MKSRKLTKTIGVINSVIFLALFIGAFGLLIGEATFLAGVKEILGFYTPDILPTNFPKLYQLVGGFLPSNMIGLIIMAVVFVLTLFCLMGSIKLISYANREIIGYRKRRGAIFFTNLFYLIFIALAYFEYFCPNVWIKWVGIGISGWLLLGIILTIADKFAAGRVYKKLKLNLQEEQARNTIKQKADTTPIVVSENENKATENLKTDISKKDKLIIEEIAKLDQLRKDGTITPVEYTRMREKVIKKKSR